MTLHIHAQQINHDDAFIVGDREGLHALRAAIDLALSSAAPAARTEVSEFVADGEGFTTHVLLCSEEEMNVLQYPYTGKVEPDGTQNTWLMGGDVHPSTLAFDRPLIEN